MAGLPKWNLHQFVAFLDQACQERSFLANTNINEDKNIQVDSQAEMLDNIIDDILPFLTESETPRNKKCRSNQLERSDRLNFVCSCSFIPKRTLCFWKETLHGFKEQTNTRLELLQAITKQSREDETDLFMKSIAMMLKKLPHNLIDQAKLEILSLVSQLQKQSLETTFSIIEIE